MAAEWTDREKRLYDALKLAVDYIGDGSPDDTYVYVMTQARAAMKDMHLVIAALSNPDTGCSLCDAGRVKRFRKFFGGHYHLLEGAYGAAITEPCTNKSP